MSVAALKPMRSSPIGETSAPSKSTCNVTGRVVPRTVRSPSSSHVLSRSAFTRGRPEGDRREVLDVEEVGTLEVAVAVVVAGAQAGGADLDLDVGVLGLLGDGDAARARR